MLHGAVDDTDASEFLSFSKFMKQCYGVGLIGAGIIAREHLAAFAALPDEARMIGVAETDAGKLRQLTGSHFIPIATQDFRELLDREDVDLIDICVPPQHHEEVVVAALEAGKHVVCEKPLAHNLAAADRILAAAAKSKGRLGVIHQYRYLPEVQRMRAAWASGLCGDPWFASFVRWGRLRGSRAIQSGWWGDWETAGGGAVTTQFIHELDLLLHFFGEVAQVAGRMDTFLGGIESEDSFTAEIRMQSGAMVSCACTLTGSRNENRYDLFGEHASLHFPWKVGAAERELQRELEAIGHQACPPIPVPSRALPARVNRKLRRMAGIYREPVELSPHAHYFRNFLQALESGAEVPVSGEDGRRALALTVAIYEAALTSEAVGVEIGPGHRFYEGLRRNDFRKGVLRDRQKSPGLGEVLS